MKIYSWDYENRLTSVNLSAGASIVNYSYDPFGKRLSKTVSGATTWCLYDSEDIVAEYANDGTLLRSYIHGPGIDEPIRMTNASTGSNYFYLSDGLGSIIQIQDSSKNTVESYIYNSFGTPIIKDSTGTTISQSAIGNPYMFTSREWDAETALYYYRARYYNSSIGRFLSEDPLKLYEFLELLDKNVLEYNGFSYVSNNPLNKVDPVGIQSSSGGNIGIIHGNYCGPGDKNDPATKMSLAPTDCIDQGCANHDACYRDKCVKWYHWLTCSSAKLNCDRQLCRNISRCNTKKCSNDTKVKATIRKVFNCRGIL